jgi:tRNA-guanine transglycosylase
VVGTKATVKGIRSEELRSVVGNSATLANTYHLFLQPGPDEIKAAGGLHTFANWPMPTMTDSGGFQVFSLGAAYGKGVTKFAHGEHRSATAPHGLNVYTPDTVSEHGKLCIVDEEGVTFTSHIDGAMYRFTAERAMEIQHKIGADITVAFDECTSPTADYAYQREAMERTHRWAKRSILAHKENYTALARQGVYGVVQGGRFLDLREESAQVLSDMDFAGYGIGGSFSRADLGDALSVVNHTLPANKPRHLLGIGEPEDIVAGVMRGCDTFDCVTPTRIARTGTAYVRTGVTRETPCRTLRYPELRKINLRRSSFRGDCNVLDPLAPLDQPIAQQYTKGYLSHLFRSGEMLGPQLVSMHNLRTIVDFTRSLREQLVSL